MIEMPQAPYSIDEFNSQAKDFVKKAKEAGKSNTAIANTLKFMYQMTLDNMKAESEAGTEWDIVKNDDGEMFWVNKKTRETESFDTGSGFDFSALEAGEYAGIGEDTQATPMFDAQGNLTLDDLFNQGTTQETPYPEALNKLSQIDNPQKTLPTPGGEAQPQANLSRLAGLKVDFTGRLPETFNPFDNQTNTSLVNRSKGIK